MFTLRQSTVQVIAMPAVIIVKTYCYQNLFVASISQGWACPGETFGQVIGGVDVFQEHCEEKADSWCRRWGWGAGRHRMIWAEGREGES